MLRLGEFIDQFTIQARQILSSNDMMSLSTVDGFTEKLIALWDTMPAALQFTSNWIHSDTQLPEWPLDVMAVNLFVKVQSFLVLLNRQRLERTSSSGSPTAPSHSGWTSSSDQAQPNRAPHKGRELVIISSVHILQAFMFFYWRQKAMLICWSMGQQAFNAAMILILDALETGNPHSEFWINQAWSVFHELNEKGVHKLAEIAVQRISDGLQMMENRRQQQDQMMSFSRRQIQGSLELDTASMTDFSSDTVMGNTGMFLLEDPGSQLYSIQPTNFQTLDWMMPSSAHTSNPSRPPSPGIPDQFTPVSDINPTPFPAPPIIPVTNAPHAIGLQHRMPPARSRISSSRQLLQQQHTHNHQMPQQFTPANTPQQSFPQHRGPVRQPNGPQSGRGNAPSGTGSRSLHHGPSGQSPRLEKAARSHRRR